MNALSLRCSTRVLAMIVAGLIVLLGAVASNAQATGVSPSPNPDLKPACGTKVILVLDESGSIQSTTGAESAVRAAANAFASGLADTGSQLAVIEFGTSAKRVFNYTNVTSGAGGSLATTFTPYFNGSATSPADVYDAPSQTGQWTNWEDALEEVKLLNSAGGVAPLVVFITDGDPTATGRTAPFATNVANSTALTPAIVQANAVKAQGSHILAVGVGAALNNATSLGRLGQVSGPDTVTSAASINLATTDVLAISNFSNLPAALRTLVNALCQTSVTINKQVDHGQGYVPGGSGWEFTANVSTATGTYTWLTPSPGPAGSRTAATGADSAVTFQWKPSAATTSTIAIAETEQLGYVLQSVACRVSSLANPTPAPLAITRNGAAFTAAVGPTDVVTCDVKNKKINPSIAIEKSVDKETVIAGTSVTYTIRVTNTGDVALNSVAVSDTVTPSCAAVVGNLAVGAFHEYTCTATITTDTTNVATVNAKDPQRTPLPPTSDDAFVDVIKPGLSIAKSVNTPTVVSGTEVTWTVTVTNTGDVPLTAVTVADDIAPGCNTVIATLAADTTAAPITCTSTITAATTNTATVTGTDPLGGIVTTDPASATVTVISPGISIVKSTTTPVLLANGVATWTILVTNTGDDALSDVTVTDPLAPNCDTTIGALAAGAAAPLITCTSVVTANTTNIATVNAKDSLGDPLPPASAHASIVVISPDFTVTKAVDTPTVLAGATVKWTVVVTNTGDVDLSNVNVSDPMAPECDGVIASIAKGASTTISCSAIITTDTVNVATVTAGYETTPEGPLVRLEPKSASAAVDVIAPNMTLTKSVDKPSVAPGTQVVFTITLTNTGDSAIGNVVLSDPLAPGCSKDVGTLAVGASATATCTQAIGATLTNVATTTGTDPLGNTISRTAEATVTVVPQIVIVGASQTTLRIDKRGPATAKSGQLITYRIKVTNSGTVTAQNVVMRDRIPTSMALASKIPGVQLVKGVVIVTVGELAPGASKTYLLKFRIDRTASGVRTNVATASAANAQQVSDSARTRIVRIAGQVRVPVVTG